MRADADASRRRQLHDHVNAEIVNGSIQSKQDAVRWLTWTFFYRRLLENPAYYGLDDASDPAAVDSFLSEIVDATVEDLVEAGTVRVCGAKGAAGEAAALVPQPLGRIASQYYLKHTTAALFELSITRALTRPRRRQAAGSSRSAVVVERLLSIVAGASEFDQMPVRHNEDCECAKIIESGRLRFPLDAGNADDPHTKVNILLQAHIGNLGGVLPNADFTLDTRSCLENAPRIVQAALELAASKRLLAVAVHLVYLLQMVVSGVWFDASSLLMLPKVDERVVEGHLSRAGIATIGDALRDPPKAEAAVHRIGGLTKHDRGGIARALRRFPSVALEADVRAEGGPDAGGRVRFEVRAALRDRRKGRGRGGAARAWSPRYPKIVNEGWVVVVGLLDDDDGTAGVDDGKLLALKRVQGAGAGGVTLRCEAAAGELAAARALRVYLLSDVYVGLDQSVDLPVPEHGGGGVDGGAFASRASSSSGDDDDDDEALLDFWIM